MIHDCSNLPGASVFLENRLVFWSVPPKCSLPDDPTRVYLCSDETLIYEQFFADFGPLNIACLVRFCRQLSLLLKDPNHSEKLIVYHTSSHGHRRSNGAVLICCFAMIELKRNVIEAYTPFLRCDPPLISFRDAAFGVCTFPLTVLDCVRGVARALSLGHFSPEIFDVDEYLYLDKIENGDVSWIVPQKFIAFSGPLAMKREIEPGVFTMDAQDYVRLFKLLGVTAVIRFNDVLYDRTIFTKNGIHHFDLFYEDGGNPPEQIMEKFIKICELEAGAIAVHCKAGLGRTGTNIGAYMMKHYGYTALECISWLRVCRPGSVVGPQQSFLQDAQARLWKAGEIMRKETEPKQISKSNDKKQIKNEDNDDVESMNGKEKEVGNDLSVKEEEEEEEENKMKPNVPQSVNSSGVVLLNRVSSNSSLGGGRRFSVETADDISCLSASRRGSVEAQNRPSSPPSSSSPKSLKVNSPPRPTSSTSSSPSSSSSIDRHQCRQQTSINVNIKVDQFLSISDQNDYTSPSSTSIGLSPPPLSNDSTSPLTPFQSSSSSSSPSSSSSASSLNKDNHIRNQRSPLRNRLSNQQQKLHHNHRPMSSSQLSDEGSLNSLNFIDSSSSLVSQNDNSEYHFKREGGATSSEEDVRPHSIRGWGSRNGAPSVVRPMPVAASNPTNQQQLNNNASAKFENEISFIFDTSKECCDGIVCQNNNSSGMISVIGTPQPLSKVVSPPPVKRISSSSSSMDSRKTSTPNANTEEYKETDDIEVGPIS